MGTGWITQPLMDTASLWLFELLALGLTVTTLVMTIWAFKTGKLWSVLSLGVMFGLAAMGCWLYYQAHSVWTTEWWLIVSGLLIWLMALSLVLGTVRVIAVPWRHWRHERRLMARPTPHLRPVR